MNNYMIYGAIGLVVAALITAFLNTTAFIVILAIAAFLAVCYLCSKFVWARIATAIILLLALTGGSMYSAIQLNTYYNAEGGIFGHISEFINPGKVYSNELEFDFKNIELVTTGKENEYGTTIISEEVFDLDADTNYAVLVNDVPCGIVQSTKNYITADYEYVFYDNDLQVKYQDTLKFRFSLNKNSTIFNISTNGGEKAIKYWNRYFNRNSFVVTLMQIDYSYSNDGSLKFTDGKVNYAVASYYLEDGQVAITQVYHPGEQVQFPTPEGYDKTFLGWSLDGKNIIYEFTINTSTNFYIVLSDEENVCTVQYVFCTDFQPYERHKLSEQVINVQKVKKGEKLSLLEAPVKQGYEFKTYTLESNEQISSDYTVENDVVVTAHYNAKRNNVSIKTVYANDLDKEYPGLAYLRNINVEGSSYIYNPDSYSQSGCLINGVFTDDDFCEEFQLLGAEYSMQSGKPRVVIESEIMPIVTTELDEYGQLQLKVSNLKAPATIKILVEPIKFNVRFKIDDLLGPNIPDVVARDVTFGDTIDVYNLYTSEQRNTITKYKSGDLTFKGYWNSDWSADQQFVDVSLHSVKAYSLSGYISYYDGDIHGGYYKFNNGWSRICTVDYDDETRTYTLYGIYANDNWFKN